MDEAFEHCADFLSYTVYSKLHGICPHFMCIEFCDPENSFDPQNLLAQAHDYESSIMLYMINTYLDNQSWYHRIVTKIVFVCDRRSNIKS